ncbi:UDP-galactopyranose mutase [uncultured Gammaproteobacteria bacterium]
MRVGILGGGLVGLVVASHSKHDCEVLELGDRPGGHCQSLVQDGYTFDIGGPHILFSRNEEILAFLLEQLGSNLERRRRNNKIFYKGRYVKYPFENGLGDLAPQDRFECLFHYLNNDHPSPSNFKEWILHNFGTGIAEKYMIPYNEKIWNVSADQMAIDWVEGRVPRPPAQDVIKAAVGVETEGYTHQLYFSYPKTGGIEALPSAFATNCPKIVTQYRVRKVWREKEDWCVSNGLDVRRYDQLVSTIALQDLIEALPDVPTEIQDRSRALRFNSLIVIMLGFEDESPAPYTAVYIPEPEFLFHRLSFPLNFTSAGAPPGQSAIMAEITTNPGDGVHELDDEAIYARVIADLARMKLADPNKLRFRAIHRTKYAYVVRTFDYSRDLRGVLDYLDGLGIISSGRNAEFEYINMDEAVSRGLAVARRLDGLFPS